MNAFADLLRRMYYPETPGDSRGRVFFYDNLRFILILLVVTRHFLFRIHGEFAVISGLYIFFLTFLMPMFIFITGFYSKSIFTKSGSYRIGRIANSILLYILLSFAIYAADLVAKGGHAAWAPWIMINASWYLWACAVWFALIPILRRVTPIYAIMVSIALSLVDGYFDSTTYFLSLSKIISFLPMFALGYYMAGDHMGALLNAKAKWRIAAFCVVMALAILTVIYHQEVNFLFKRVVEAKDPYAIAWDGGRGLAALGPIWRALWYMAVAAMSVCAILLVPRKKTFFTLPGSRTLQIYIWHSLIVRLLIPTGFFLWVDSLGEGFGQVVMVLSAFALTMFLSLRFMGAPFGKLEGLTRKWEVGHKAP